MSAESQTVLEFHSFAEEKTSLSTANSIRTVESLDLMELSSGSSVRYDSINGD